MSWQKNERRSRKPGSTRGSRQPIADKVIRRLRRNARNGVIDLGAWDDARKCIDEMHASLGKRGGSTVRHAAHRPYVFVQNLAAATVEQLTALPEVSRFTNLLESAHRKYMPSGPPMSPLTGSYFYCWILFDACMGIGKETLSSVTAATAKELGGHADVLRLLDVFSRSHMAVHVHEGSDGDLLHLRDIATSEVVRAVSPSGYVGSPGELIFARVLPPPSEDQSESVIFTTPYRLRGMTEVAWKAYLDRHLPGDDSAVDERIAAYRNHMKYGLARHYWNEFVFEGYVGHSASVIDLEGFPDIEESRPHSRARS